MSCTCDKSKNCEPCAFCTPPGVRCLPDCPSDPCPERIDLDCVIYSGEDHSCSNISNGESISPIIMQALSLIFPLDECCYFEATAFFIDPPPSKYVFCRSYEDGDCERACSCDTSSEPNTIVYSLDSSLVPGSMLYSDQNLTIPAAEGWYCANGICITIAGGSSGSIPGIPGVVQSVTVAPSSTTTTSSTTTLTPCYCYTVTILSSTVVTYIDCDGASVSTPILSTGTVEQICAESIFPNSNYTFTSTQFCDDRVNCPTTTTTTTAAPTTTTTTLPPCNCITFTNTGNQGTISWKDCDGHINNATIAAKDPITGEATIVTKCGSSGGASAGISVIAGGPCSGTGSSAICSSPATTTIPCSQFVLQCCKNNTATPIIIQPCFVNTTVPLSVGSIYIDDQSRYWVVTGATGTPNNTYVPGFLTFYQAYSSVSAALAACQSISVNQTALCPGITTTQGPALPYSLFYNVSSCTGACYGTGATTYYSRCSSLASGCRLYTDLACLNPVNIAGYYSDHTTCYTVNASGYIGSVNPCSNYTTTTSSTTTTTKFTKYIRVKNQLPANWPRITNVGSWMGSGSNGSLTPFPTLTWTTGGPTVNPGQTSEGTYTMLVLTQIGVQISPTTIGFINLPVYAHIYVNGTHIDCMAATFSASDQTLISSAHQFNTGDEIEIRLNRTPC